MQLMSFINLLVLLILQGCVNNSPSNLVFKEEIKAATKSKPPAAPMSPGKRLWTTNCAACHTNNISGLPTKLYASERDIEGAIVKEKSMQHLKILNSDEISLISDYLNKEAILAAQNAKKEQKAASKSILGSRNYVTSKLLSLFLSSTGSTSDDTKIKAIVAFISNYPGAFGGTCVYYHDTCTGEYTENYQAEMNASANVIRSGIMIKVCREIHDNSSAITNALSYVGLTSTDDATNGNLQKMIDAYIPGTDDPEGKLLGELRTVHSQSVSKGMSKKDAWNMVSYAICSSPVFEKL